MDRRIMGLVLVVSAVAMLFTLDSNSPIREINIAASFFCSGYLVAQSVKEAQ